MTDNVQAYPLQWPLGRQRTKSRAAARFITNTRGGYNQRRGHSVTEGVGQILHELELMDVDNASVVISTNLQLRTDGLPRSGQPQPTDPGVAVYFRFDGQPVCLACDQWTKVEDNLWAVCLTLEAMRGIDRWGAAKLSATFTGYAALPAPAESEPWWEVLEVAQEASSQEIRNAHRNGVRAYHPDVAGARADVEKFHKIQRAYEQAERLGRV